VEVIIDNSVESKIQQLKEQLENTLEGQELGELGTYQYVGDPELVVEIIESLDQCLRAGVDLSDLISLIAQIHHLDRRESTKSRTELYLQYRAAALLDASLAQEIPFSNESIKILLASGKKYVSDHATKEYMCSIYWRLADRGVNISSVIQSLDTIFHNSETNELVRSSLMALWAAVRNGDFDTQIPDSENTYQVWLKHVIGDATYKLKKKDEENKLGSVGLLLEIVSRYPDTKSLANEYLITCKIREPKRITTDYQRDLKDYFLRCKE
jgi:hypothetical protein